MRVISLTGASKPHLKRTCAAIGIFDGVHRGHQYLIKKMLAAAHRLKALPVVITFFPHPAHVLRPDIKLGYLCSFERRLQRLKDLGVSACIVVHFSRAFAKVEPQKFIRDTLVKQLGVKAVFVGDDFRFGRDRMGDIVLFKELGRRYGYETHAVAPLKQGGMPISSTRIRLLVGAGYLAHAARLLGRDVSVSGKVVRGAGRGRDLGFPTANVAYETDILPPQGVYVVKIVIGKKEYQGMANIGTRPSFEKQKTRLHLEVFILDFSQNIYGKEVEVKFLKKIRSEKKFPGAQALIARIRKDESFTRKYFS